MDFRATPHGSSGSGLSNHVRKTRRCLDKCWMMRVCPRIGRGPKGLTAIGAGQLQSVQQKGRGLVAICCPFPLMVLDRIKGHDRELCAVYQSM